jgi:hypothetical protein
MKRHRKKTAEVTVTCRWCGKRKTFRGDQVTDSLLLLYICKDCVPKPKKEKP